MKILTYNVNGIRSAISKGFDQWLAATNADMIALQEVKANITDIDTSIFENLGYQLYWYPAEKKGYSGVAIFTKHPPTVKGVLFVAISTTFHL
jgi:exodeoxyribonuclease III